MMWEFIITLLYVASLIAGQSTTRSALTSDAEKCSDLEHPGFIHAIASSGSGTKASSSASKSASKSASASVSASAAPVGS